MLSKDFKEIIDLTGGRYIVIENGKPKYIIMSFEEYKSAILEKNSLKTLTEKELVAKINSDIALWRENQKPGAEKIMEEIEGIDDIEYVA